MYPEVSPTRLLQDSISSLQHLSIILLRAHTWTCHLPWLIPLFTHYFTPAVYACKDIVYTFTCCLIACCSYVVLYTLFTVLILLWFYRLNLDHFYSGIVLIQEVFIVTVHYTLQGLYWLIPALEMQIKKNITEKRRGCRGEMDLTALGKKKNHHYCHWSHVYICLLHLRSCSSVWLYKSLYSCIVS